MCGTDLAHLALLRMARGYGSQTASPQDTPDSFNFVITLRSVFPPFGIRWFLLLNLHI